MISCKTGLPCSINLRKATFMHNSFLNLHLLSTQWIPYESGLWRQPTNLQHQCVSIYKGSKLPTIFVSLWGTVIFTNFQVLSFLCWCDIETVTPVVTTRNCKCISGTQLICAVLLGGNDSCASQGFYCIFIYIALYVCMDVLYVDIVYIQYCMYMWVHHVI